MTTEITALTADPGPPRLLTPHGILTALEPATPAESQPPTPVPDAATPPHTPILPLATLAALPLHPPAEPVLAPNEDKAPPPTRRATRQQRSTPVTDTEVVAALESRIRDRRTQIETAQQEIERFTAALAALGPIAATRNGHGNGRAPSKAKKKKTTRSTPAAPSSDEATMADLIEAAIKTARRPMFIDELFEAMQAHRPDTSRASVSQTLGQMRAAHRLVSNNYRLGVYGVPSMRDKVKAIKTRPDAPAET